MLFTLPLCLFRALSLFDIHLEDAPTQDAPLRIANRETLNMEPAVDAIRAPLADLNVVRLPAFERPARYGNSVRQVIRVNGVRARPLLQFFEGSCRSSPGPGGCRNRRLPQA